MTIAEVAKRFDLTADTLRYYERVGIIPEVGRSSGGIRDYTEEDCSWIALAKCLRGAGVQIEALARYVYLFRQGEHTFDERYGILVEQREGLKARIADMQAALERLDHKIERYEKQIQPVEHELRIS